MIDHALALAARGFAVFPCHRITHTGCSCSKPACDSPGKHPVTRDGFKSATRDPDAIRALWGPEPWNIGIATGAVSGVVVVDSDPRHGGDLSALNLPPTLTARTGSGGLHLFFAHPGGRVPNSASRLAPGVDVRGDGGYVVAPPSNHASGGVYAWEEPLQPLAPCPPEVVEAMRRRGPRSPPAAAATPAPLPPATAARPPAAKADDRDRDRERRYALAALEGAARDLRDTPKGARHDAAFAKAHKVGGYVGAGLLTEGEAEARLLYATRAGGWDAEREGNTIKAIRDGLAAGASRPLTVPDAPARASSATSQGVASTVEADERAAIQAEEPTKPAMEPTAVTTTDETIDPARALLAGGGEKPPPPVVHLFLKRDKKGDIKNTYANTVATVRHIHGGGPTNPTRRLAFNEMTLTPVLDGKPQREGHDLSALRERIELDHGFAPSAENVKAAVLHVAHEQSFHPVRAFLDSLPPWDGIARVDSLARLVLKIDPASQPLALVFLQKWLISAVARAYDPGCQVDTALVLFGEQGLQKTKFYRVLAGPQFFANTKMTDLSNKDAIMQLHSAWFYEWGEIDAITSQRHAGEVKGFITVQTDVFRAPYAAAVAAHPRSCVIVGSTNKEKFLSDPTGSRRFWIIDLDHLDPMAGDRIDTDALSLMRLQLWAEAVHRYRSGEQWWLTPEEDTAREEAAERHAVEDHPWREFVERWLAKKEQKGALRPLDYPQDQIHITDIFDAMKLEPAHRKHADAVTMGNVLRSLGFERRKRRVHYGDKPTLWMWIRERGTTPHATDTSIAPVIPIR